MNLFCKIGISVSKTDNGWVLEWKNEKSSKEYTYSGIDREPKTRGIEIFIDKKDLLKRIEQLI